MKYFIDTEFHEHKKPVKFLGITIKKVWTIDLISIAIVCEDGREYYAINRDLNLKHAKKDEFLKRFVLPKLPRKEPLYPPHGSVRLWQMNRRWLPLNCIKEEIIDFCGAKIDSDESGSFYVYPDGKPEFYGYYSDYDWVVFCWIFGRMFDLPNGFPMYCKDLKQMLDEKFPTAEQLEEAKKSADYPVLLDGDAHDALVDARWNLKLFKFLQK